MLVSTRLVKGFCVPPGRKPKSDRFGGYETHHTKMGPVGTQTVFVSQVGTQKSALNAFSSGVVRGEASWLAARQTP